MLAGKNASINPRVKRISRTQLIKSHIVEMKMIKQTRMKRVRTLSSDSGCDLLEMRNEDSVDSILDQTKAAVVSMVNEFFDDKFHTIKQNIPIYKGE